MARRGQWIAVGLIIGALVAAIVIGMSLTPDIRPVRPGSQAPEFQAANVMTGDTVTLADYEGEVVLLNIWATWCAPCEKEMPSMQRLHELLGPEGLRVVAVSVDAIDSERVREWAQERDLTFDILHNRSGRIERDYQTTAVPETFILDRDGVIVRKEISAREWDSEMYIKIFTRLMGSEEDGAVSGNPLNDRNK
ncbi:MAG: TlpA family protein disulfide reductase [Gemmatimonadota bacterium]|nr:MAG: TlpA family protein disulfide reductase [Gemmatimonadota bacterium]